LRFEFEVAPCHTIDFERNENSFKFIITLESFVSKVSINLATLLAYSIGSKC
jgi:hypothetical protein